MRTAEEATRQVSGAPALSFTGLVLAHIDPNRGSRYSPNLFAFLNHRRNRNGLAPRARVYRDKGNTQWIGYFDDTGMFVGARLSLVLCYGAKAEVTCPINLGAMFEVEGFWARYAEVGRCAIDIEHTTAFLGDDARWTYDGDTRHCQWCGEVSQKMFTRLVTTEHKSWKNVEKVL